MRTTRRAERRERPGAAGERIGRDRAPRPGHAVDIAAREVSGVFRSPWASNQSTAPGPRTDASPPSVPRAIEYRPRGRWASARPPPSPPPRGDALAGLLDLVEETRLRAPARRRLGDRRLDVPPVRAPDAELPQAIVRVRVADRGGPHVDPAPPRAGSSAAPMMATFLSLPSATAREATLRCRGEVAQLVEHTAENRGVAGSIPALATPHSYGVPRCRACAPGRASRRPGARAVRRPRTSARFDRTQRGSPAGPRRFGHARARTSGPCRRASRARDRPPRTMAART